MEKKIAVLKYKLITPGSATNQPWSLRDNTTHMHPFDPLFLLPV